MLSGQRLFRTIATLALSAGIVAAACAAPAHTDGAFSAAAPQKKKSKVPKRRTPGSSARGAPSPCATGSPTRPSSTACRPSPSTRSISTAGTCSGGLLHERRFRQVGRGLRKGGGDQAGAADVQRNLGLAYVELKETEKAEAALKRALDSTTPRRPIRWASSATTQALRRGPPVRAHRHPAGRQERQGL